MTTIEEKTKQRPKSWDATMLSGRRLITDKQFEQLLANSPSWEEMEHHDPKPVVKLFLPMARWLLVWGYPQDLDRFFCVVQLGNDMPEAGDVCLSEIVNVQSPFSLEQDLYIRLDKPWSHYLNRDSDW
jgi:hypothetical protein